MGDLGLPQEDVLTLFPGSSPARPPEPAKDVFDPEDHPQGLLV